MKETVGFQRLLTVKSVLLPPQDPRLVYRLVGFLEYGRAIESLSRFVEQATSRELGIADEIIRERDSLVVYVNLSRLIEGNSSLSERSENPRDDYERRGLAWILALARVELGAMLAGFTSHPQPFQATAPGTMGATTVRVQPIDSETYREIITDGMRSHYWALRNEGTVQHYYKSGVPENHLVTYGRRTIVARRFLWAAREYSLKKFATVQLAEMDAWDKYIKQTQLVLLYCLSRKTGKERTLTTKTRTSYTGSALLKSFASKNLGINTKDRNVITVSHENLPKLADFLLLIDPTLRACPCR